MTEEKSLECLLTVKSGGKSMTLIIGQDGFDTDEWMEAFKSHFPTPPEGEYEASFVFEDEEYTLGVYNFHGEVIFPYEEDDGEDQDVPEDVMEEFVNRGIIILCANIFSDLLDTLGILLLC